ncbi:hypothetical protein OQ968_03840 [Mycobacterium sp. 663a-19]|nr:hypothetical protein [Mycobacterium sp. 663a-19]MEB3980390.1 hypothetical protein [Mycobacterium sp. 663a-19]
MPSRPPEPRCQPTWPSEAQPKTNPEKKITAATNTTPAIMPVHAKV